MNEVNCLQWRPICPQEKGNKGIAYVEVVIGSMLLTYILLVFVSFISDFASIANYMESKNEVIMDGRFTRAMIGNRIRRTRGELVIKEGGQRIDSMKGDWKIGVRDRSLAAILSDGQRQTISQKTISPNVGVLRLDIQEGPIFEQAKSSDPITIRWRMVVDPYEQGQGTYGQKGLSYEVHTKVLPDYMYFQWKP